MVGGWFTGPSGEGKTTERSSEGWLSSPFTDLILSIMNDKTIERQVNNGN